MSNPHPSEPEIDWVPLGKITIYPVTEQELTALEKGSPESIFLTFSIFCLSVGVSAVLSIFAIDTNNLRVLVIYLVISILGMMIGVVLLCLWYVFRKDGHSVIQSIRSRKKVAHGNQLPGSSLPPAVFYGGSSNYTLLPDKKLDEKT